MPTKTDVASAGICVLRAASRRATSRTSSCCGNVCLRSLGGKRRPDRATSTVSTRDPCSPLSNAWRNCWAFSKGPAVISRSTMAMAERCGASIGLTSVCAAASGFHSSTIRWALLPPKPKALTAARRGVDGSTSHGSGACSMRNGVPSMASSGCSTGREGGRVPVRIAPSTLSRPATPATVIRWPRFDFNEPMGRSATSPKISAELAISMASPTGVPVAWHSSREMSLGFRPAIS